MKKIKKRIILLILCLFICTVLLPISVAAENNIHLNEACSLSILFAPNGIKAADVEFNLYRVSNISSSNNFELTKTFNKYPVVISNDNQFNRRDTAETLAGFVYADQIVPDYVCKTNSDGKALFKNIASGLYLVTGNSFSVEDRVYIPQSFIISLPNDVSTDRPDYNISIDVKYDSYFKNDKHDIKVMKVWKDNNSSLRSKNVVIELYKDSKLYNTAVLSKENNWHYEWKNLNKGSVWSVKEKTVCNGYTVNVSRQDNCFVVTNTFSGNITEKPSKPTTPSGGSQTLPQTGLLWWPVPLMICVGLLLFVIGNLRHNGDDYEK